VTFEWDEAKSEWTRTERGFDFDYASTIFMDEERVENGRRERNGEVRYFTIGKAVHGEILFVVFTWRYYENEKVCRITSARQAHKTERKRYPQIR
jgi:hypothetical protein